MKQAAGVNVLKEIEDPVDSAEGTEEQEEELAVLPACLCAQRKTTAGYLPVDLCPEGPLLGTRPY